MLAVEIVGSQRLRNKLSKLADKDIRRIDRNALNKGMTVIQKGIKSEIPSGQKDLKKTIGKRFKKNRRKGLKEAKVGAGVGKKKKQKEGAKDQWYLFLLLTGTAERFNRFKESSGGGSSRDKRGRFVSGSGKKPLRRPRYTGRIVKMYAVPKGFAKTESLAKEVMRMSLESGIEKAMGGP